MPFFSRIILTASIIAASSALSAQSTSLPIPAPVKEAIEASTRTMEGKPGPNYFQNHTDYVIHAQLHTDSDSLSGNVVMTYHNDSPDALDKLVVRLYQDMYKKDFKTDDEIKKGDRTTGTGIYKLLIDGQPIDIDGSVERTGTNMVISLAEPLLAGASTTLEIDWAFSIPNESLIRMGRFYKGSYFLAYWYPQMAVYDDVYGWDMIDYTGTVEFYNDFGNFDLYLTAPDDYILWSTGVLQNPEEILAEPFLSRYRAAWTSDTVIRIVSKKELDDQVKVTLPAASHTWHFQAEGVPDAAFAAANNYLWDGASVVVDDETGRRVMTEACYRAQAKDFYDVAGFAQEIVRDLSTEIPGIPYPYPHITVYNGDKGGGGMEYPMMVNDASVFSEMFAFSLTYHEIAHTYFPFYMGINERRFAWMDEGWATFLPEDLMVKKGYQDEPLRFSMMGYNAFAGTKSEKPMMTPSYELQGMAYGIASYPKPGVAYTILRDILGEEEFRRVLLGYMDRWHGKHPGPYDFFFSFNDLSGKNLDWFWKPWFFETTRPDLAIKKIKIKGKSAHFLVNNVGGLPVPIHLVIKLIDGTEVLRHVSAEVWATGASSWEFEEKFGQNIAEIKLGAGWIPDVNNGDNRWKPGE
ncbi:MAG: M1 family metallopeptidase [Bacteroidia bacterium]|nr:M1 family metallopeptidase [Bacteroidia bacterium]